jgi:hypothetical protein
MKDEDLRDLFAVVTLFKMSVIHEPEETAKWCYEVADAMLEAKYYEEPEEPEVGITAIKTKRKTAKE